MIENLLGRDLSQIEVFLVVFVFLTSLPVRFFGYNLWSSDNEENWHPIARRPIFRIILKVLWPLMFTAFGILLISLSIALITNLSG